MDRRGRAVSRVSTRRRARTRTGGAVFRPRARQRQRCRLGCRLGRRRGERRDLTGGRARERGGADATRDPRQPRARRVPRRVRRAPGSRRAAHARLRRGGTDAPSRGITPRGGGYGILPSVAPHGAQMRHTSRPRGAQIQPGGVQGARYSVLRRGVTRVSARRRAVGDDWIGGRNGGRRLDARFGFKRLGGVRGEMESRDEHLHFALGRQVAHAGSILAAEEYFRRLLECARRQPAATQSTYLREYLYVARCAADAAAADEKTKLRLDRTDLHRTGSNRRRTRTSVCLFPSSTRATFACTSRMDTATPSRRPRAARRPRARRGPRRVGRAWRRTDWFPRVTGGGATWLDKPREKGAEQRGVCAAGEEVGVDVRFRNPLKIPIDVTDVRLACEFEADAGSGGGVAGAEVPSTASSTAPSTASSTVSSTAPSSAPSTEPSTAPSTWVSTPPAAATLEPGETTTLRLGCTPSRAGTLRIVGVTWTLCDATRGFRRFDVRAPRTRRARGANGALEWTRDVPREKRLAFTVVPAMPRLEVSLEGLPATLPAGAAALATLRVRNVASGGPDGGAGTGPAAHRVRVRLPSGGVALPADAAAAGEIGDASEAKSASEGKSPSDAKSASASDPSKRGSPNVSQTSPSSGGPIGTTYEPPAWSRLPAGAEATMALWIHPTETGAVDVPVVVCYEPPPPAPPLLKYRTVRCAAGTIATPSMVVSATVANAATHPAARVVRVSAANATSGSEAPKSSYEIRSVALVREGDGPRATLTTMGAPASTPRIVAPGRRWDTLLLAAPATEVEDAAFDADSANCVSAKIRIGAAAESEPTPGSRPPVVRLHRASAPERFGGRGAADSGTSRANATNANGRADVLDGVDVVVEWSEIPPRRVRSRRRDRRAPYPRRRRSRRQERTRRAESPTTPLRVGAQGRSLDPRGTVDGDAPRLREGERDGRSARRRSRDASRA